MGSEHYCLRWNNHQSNLLGVFSQLLQDESLVDVTLACSEGALIKAHKVVLSACSSYFQSLFLDHPEKHPIVILKDVRLAELKTLVEFMYKGEVNVQYCQLSALLKTAESLKVKGLAEMTNQNTTLREPEREPDRLRPHSQPCKSSCESPVNTTLTGGPNSSIANSGATSATSINVSVALASTIATSTTTTTAVSATATPVSTTAAVVAATNQQQHQEQQQQQAATSTESTFTTSTTATTGTAGTATTASSAQKRDASSERGGTPSAAPPTKRQQMSAERDSSPIPLDLYQGRSVERASSAECVAINEERAMATTPHATSKSNNNNLKHMTSSGLSGTSAELSQHNNGNGESKARQRRTDSDDEDDDEDRGGVAGGAYDSSPARPASCSMLSRVGLTLGVVEKIEEPDSYDEDMELEEDVDDNSSNDAMGLNMKIGAAISHSAASLALPSPLGGGSGGGGGDPESARSTPAAATSGLILASDLMHPQHRATSRSPRDVGGVSASGERPSSSGVCGMAATSAGVGMSPSPSSAAAQAAAQAAANSESLTSTSGLGPVQSVPLSLKKEIDCSEDDNSNSRHMHHPRSASVGGGMGGDLDYRLSTHESLFRHFGSPFNAMGNGSSAALAATHCPTPFTFPFTPFGLSLFDIDPSRILGMLRHQTWLAEEALKNRNMLNTPKDFTHRYNPIGDLFAKDLHQNHAHANTADVSAGVASPHTRASAASPIKLTTSPHNQQQTALQHASERNNKIQYKQQQRNHHQQQQQTFNVRYPSPAAFFHHQQQQQQHQHKEKSSRQGTPSPHASATSTQSKRDTTPTPTTPITATHAVEVDENAVIELTTNDDARDSGRESAVHTPNNSSGTSSGIGTSTTTSTGALSSACSPLLYKESLEQLLQRRRSSSSLGGVSDSFRSYTQLLLSTSTPGCTDTSSCKEKSSSSSTSSTPPPTSTLLAQHQLLSQRLNSPSETSSLYGESIEEETRCVVCNAHFPNVWLLEQHAALQHPHIGPGEEKPFICEQCGQSYRYRSAYAKHKEQNHRARLPADRLFTCDVCGMQFRYLKSFKKHRLNHALERLHGKKGVLGKHCLTPVHIMGEQDVVTSLQEPMVADEGGEDLRINIKKEQDDDVGVEPERERDDQICADDSSGMMLYNKNNNSVKALTTISVAEVNVSSSDGIHSTNKGPRLLTTQQIETDPSYHHFQRHPQHHLQQHLQQQQHLQPHLHGSVAVTSLPPHQHPLQHQNPQHPHAALPHTHHTHTNAHHAVNTLNSLNSLNSITSLINAERIPNEQFLGLNPQEASILNFLRVDAAERQRDKRPQASRFACPFCGKCVRSKENLKLHVRKHTGERPFVCLFCGRAFGGKSDLTRHLRIHTGERPYHCESCGKCFARADYLSKHLTTHIHNAPR